MASEFDDVKWPFRIYIGYMRLWVKQGVSIIWLTVLESIRQPVVMLLFASAVIFIALMPLVITQTLGESGKLVRDSAIAFYFLCGLILGAYVACISITHEIRRGTMHAILSKPVSRSLFFLSKFLGVSLVMACYSLGATLAIIMSERTARIAFHLDWWSAVPLLSAPVAAFILAGIINYAWRRPFSSTAFGWLLAAVILAFLATGFVDHHGHPVPFGEPYAWNLPAACVLIGMAIMVLAGLAVGLAPRLKTVPTISVCGVVFLLGLISDYLFGRHADTHMLAALLYTLIPNWQHFWVADALADGETIPLPYIAAVARYALLYLAGLLSFGLVLFQHAEIKS